MADMISFIETLERYRDQGIPPGSCTHAILANDLIDAMGRADATTRPIMFDICLWIQINLPYAAYGNYDKINAWIEHRGLSGLPKALEVNQ